MPYRIMMRNSEWMVMAGIWDVWKEDNQIIKSFSILTTSSNKEMELVHNRMPIILPTKDLQKKWLSDISLEEVLGMLQTVDDNSLKIYRVSDKVNSIKINLSDLHHEMLIPPTLFD